MTLSRDAILRTEDLKTVDVDVPEWGGSVRVRMLTSAERYALHAAATVAGKFEHALFAAGLVARTAIDEAGQRLFQDDDASALAAKSAVAVGRIFDAATVLNGMAARAVDAAEKNSASAPSGSS